MRKRLVKSENRLIAGVAAGVAEYLGLNTTAVRVIWGILGLCYGAGIAAYIIAAVLMPAE